MRTGLALLLLGALAAAAFAWLDPCYGHRFGTLCETPGNPLGASLR